MARQKENPYTKSKETINRGLIEKVLQAKKLIDENEGTRLKIPEIAQKIYLNEQQLKKGFSEKFNISIGKYQIQQRIDKAANLLANTSFPIQRIAILVGYEDKSSFSEKFKKHYGMTPGDYRKRHNSNFKT